MQAHGKMPAENGGEHFCQECCQPLMGYAAAQLLDCFSSFRKGPVYRQLPQQTPLQSSFQEPTALR